MAERTDNELVALGRRGDPAALGELFTRYWRLARGVAFGVTGEFSSAEDAAAEAFRQALAGLASLEDGERFGAWLRTIVVRKARLARQRCNRESSPLAAAGIDAGERPDAALERLEFSALLQQAVNGLPERQREAVALCHYEGYDQSAAARFLGVPEGTLRRRLHEGRRMLRDSAARILQGREGMKEQNDQRIEALKRRIDTGDVYQAMREGLALRPPPEDLARLFAPRPGQQADLPAARLRETAGLLRPSGEALDPHHPVGAMAVAIRRALPEFAEWHLDPSQAARFLTFTGEHRNRLRAILPPGFAEGRPGAFLRATRAIMRPGDAGPARSVYQLLRDGPEERSFREAMEATRFTDVLDLTWMEAGAIELRAVQALLERLIAALLPGAETRFSPYDEPRYRSALQVQTEGAGTRLAHGGVLREWPGQPPGVDSAHVRLFLEPWAAIGYHGRPGRNLR